MSYKDEAIENALAWCRRSGYAFASEALDAYCAQTGASWRADHNDVVRFDTPGTNQCRLVFSDGSRCQNDCAPCEHYCPQCQSEGMTDFGPAAS